MATCATLTTAKKQMLCNDKSCLNFPAMQSKDLILRLTFSCRAKMRRITLLSLLPFLGTKNLLHCLHPRSATTRSFANNFLVNFNWTRSTSRQAPAAKPPHKHTINPDKNASAISYRNLRPLCLKLNHLGENGEGSRISKSSPSKDFNALLYLS